ncbi:MAG: hypothetical protein U5R48_14865 [Gammaproteobacteria bacterium]|nr:hypothetical protein [Gammaproteobacteria bacterium]
MDLGTGIGQAEALGGLFVESRYRGRARRHRVQDTGGHLRDRLRRTTALTTLTLEGDLRTDGAGVDVDTAGGIRFNAPSIVLDDPAATHSSHLIRTDDGGTASTARSSRFGSPTMTDASPTSGVEGVEILAGSTISICPRSRSVVSTT